MPQLFLRFHDVAFDSFDWAVVDVNAENADAIWQKADVSELLQLISQNPLPVTIFVPQQAIFVTEFEVPEKAPRQVLASIEYQIEDRLAQDTDTQHFAVGKQKKNIVPVFVVAQPVMLAIQSLQQNYQLKIQQVLAEMFLCPVPTEPGEVTIINSHFGVVVRYGDNNCVKCLPEVLPSILDLVNRQDNIIRINCYMDESAVPEVLKDDDYPVNIEPYRVSEIDFDKVVNLQQRQYQASSHWLKIFQAWKGIAAAAMILLSVFAVNRVAALEDMEQQLSSIKASQYELIKDYVGPQVTRDSNLKTEMIKLLQKSGSSDQELDFLQLLLEFSRARESHRSIEIIKIGYQQERLSVDISSKQLNVVESLHAALKAKGLSVDLERLNIKPELVSGQFIVRGSSDG
jgi:type II secretion system protein L